MHRLTVSFLGLGMWLTVSASAQPTPPTQLPTRPAAVSTQSHFARLGTNRVHYLTAGSGTQTLVFVHGWACSAEFWREQIPAFADKARLIFIDLPGHGASDKPQTDYTMNYFAQAVLAVMKDAGVDRATLIGHSMGTPVICQTFALARDKVAGLVAVDGILRRPQGTPDQFERFVAPYRGAGYREHTIKFIDSMFPNPGTEGLRDRVREEMLRTPQHVMAGAMEGMFKPGQADWQPASAKVPVLSINAENPRWTGLYEKFVRGLSEQSDYQLMPKVGHFLMLEDPAEFNRILLSLLEKFKLVKT